MKLSYLFESLNSPVKYVWSVKTPDMWKGVFKIDDSSQDIEYNAFYEFYAIYGGPLDAGDFWELGFQLKTDKRSNQKLTGTGSEFAVFATVIKMMEEFGKKVNPSEVRIHADKDEGARESLYKKLLTRYAGKNGYSFNIETENGITAFILTKN